MRCRKYTYLIWLNSSVRGPFLPTYARMHWTEAFTGKLSNVVKLVRLGRFTTFCSAPAVGVCVRCSLGPVAP